MKILIIAAHPDDEVLGIGGTAIKHVKKGLKSIPNMELQVEKPRAAYIQTLLSRGDRKVAHLLHHVLENQGNWAKTLKSDAIDSEFYTYRDIPPDELLPWDFIDHGINKQFLLKEYKKAIRAQISEPCPIEDCHICGVCEKE